MMNDTDLIPVLLTAGCGLCQYFALILTGFNKPRVWKWGIYAGMGGSGWAAAGFMAERLNPAPWPTFGLATLFMLASVVVSYYQAIEPAPGATEEAVRQAEARQHSALFRMGIGIIMLLCIAVAVAYMDGQKKGEKLQAVSVAVLGDVVKVLKQLQRTADSNVRRLDERDRMDRVADSTFRAESINNQKKGLKNQADILREQEAVKRNLRAKLKSVPTTSLIIVTPTAKGLPQASFPLPGTDRIKPVPISPVKKKPTPRGKYGWEQYEPDTNRYANFRQNF